MIKRIELILKTQNLTPSQLADRLGVQRPVMSHVLSGRNKPSLDFVMKVLSVFPQINPNWLLFGNGKMYAEMTGGDFAPDSSSELVEYPVQASVQDSVQDNNLKPVQEPLHPSVQDKQPELFYDDDENSEEEEPLDFVDTPLSPVQVQDTDLARTTPQNTVQPSRSVSKRVEKVVFFYSDGTFKDYLPSV